VEVKDATIRVGDCHFLGICKLGEDQAGRVIRGWNAYKRRYNFQPRIEKAMYVDATVFPDEVTQGDSLREGAVSQVRVNAYERNPEARRKCITHYGASCFVCEFNFEERYGSVGEGFIHVHHLRSLSEIGEEYDVDPVSDLRPICPNCHAMIHRRNPSFTIEEIKSLLRVKSRVRSCG
jgi:predicted HNH restriction endonuclease